MPELRKDPIIGRWVVISTEREKRPDNFKFSPKNFQEDDCPFCEGKESCTPKEIAAVRENKTQPDTAGWKVRIVSSNNPIFRIEGNLGRKGHGIHDQLNGIGAHEVIIETPKHIANICDLSQEQIT